MVASGTVQSTTETNNGCVCSCGRTLKNEHGLKIHRGRMGCPAIMNLVQRTRQLGETEEGQVLEQPHSDRKFHEPDEREEGGC